MALLFTRLRSTSVLLAFLLVGCTDDGARDDDGTSLGDGTGSGDGDGDGDMGDGDGDGDTGDGDGDTNTDTGDVPAACEPEGTVECPIVIDTFPTLDARDTTMAPADGFDAYACAPATDESGPEFVYRIDVPSEGIVTAWVGEAPGVDVDVHLLGSADPNDCITRDNTTVGWRVSAGSVYLLVDTWAGEAQAGAYELRVDFLDGQGNCGLELFDQGMHWQACDPGLDCYENGGEFYLRTPALGPVVKEAHLVTVDDSFGDTWPTSFTDGITDHYALSESATGFVADRGEPWAPAGRGGSEYGQGSTGVKIPVVDEAWYVNMYWKPRPDGGTRVLVYDPATGQAVVASGGYETGPGSNESIGGAVEEIHLALGTVHHDRLVMGFLSDAQLPLGPIDCDGG